MKSCVLLVLVLALGCTAQNPADIDVSVVETLVSLAKQVDVNEALFDAPLQPVDDVVHKPADACRDCIHDGAFHIIRHVAEHIKEHCDKATCPVIKAHCAFIADHREVVLGMLIEHLRPASHAAAYCAGKGVCHHDDAPQFYNGTYSNKADELDGEFIARALDLDNYTDARHPEITPEGVEQAISSMPPPPPLTEGDKEDETDHHDREECFRCVHGVAGHIMHEAVGHIIEHCHHVECPVAKRHCEWMKQHHQVVFGILLAKLNPHHTAGAFCFGRGACPHPHPPPHHHRH